MKCQKMKTDVVFGGKLHYFAGCAYSGEELALIGLLVALFRASRVKLVAKIW